MEFRTSTRWFSCESSVRRVHAIPFVSKSGKLSINTLYFWRAYPEQVLFSMISTIYQRILKILIKRFDYVSRRLRDACIKVSTIYAITKDDYIIDRFLGISKKWIPIKLISNLAHYFAFQLDDDKRFVYSQALKRADWLKYQVSRLGDKSSKHMCHQTHLRNLLDESEEQSCSDSQLFSNACAFFTTERQIRYPPITHHDLSDDGLEFVEDFVSEPLYDFEYSEED
jgi:hypothetical protein